ncbi:MAG: hypothetical protein FJ272_17485, partial [Planctomycetes bacterium]|nr:hypothetical protein [Planctomycetota bacterium]
MTETELRNLLAKREGEGIECKPNLLSRREIAEYAVGIGNAGGGWLIMGVTDRVPRRVIPQPVPPDDEIARTRESVADSAQIHIEIEAVPTRDGLALVCRIPSRPRGMPFHTRDGKYLIRLGEGLRGMTLAELDAIRREAGGELTAATVPGTLADLISPSGMEELRGLMAEVGAPPELVKQTDRDLLRSLDMIGSDGRLRVAGLLLAGKPEAIHAHVPYAQWQFFRMRSDTEYDLSERGLDCFPVALKRLRQLVAANNPIVTIPG